MKKKKLLLFFILVSVNLFSEPKYPVPSFPPYNYRGKRTDRNPKDFKLMFIRTSKSYRDVFDIDIFFNQGIDPRSANSENILINSNPLSENVPLYFSKDGSMIRITLRCENGCELELKGITSFLGIPLKEPVVQRIEPNHVYKYKLPEVI